MPSQDAISQSVNRYLEVVAPRSPDPAGLLQVRGSLAPQAIQHHTRHDPALPLIACYLELGMTTHRATDRFKRRAPSAAGRSQTALAPSLGPALLDQHPVVVALRVRLAQIELDVAEKDRTIASLQDDVEFLQETNRSLVRDYGLTRGRSEQSYEGVRRCVAQPVSLQPVAVGRVHRRAVTAELPVADLARPDEQPTGAVDFEHPMQGPRKSAAPLVIAQIHGALLSSEGMTEVWLWQLAARLRGPEMFSTAAVVRHLHNRQ